MEGGSVLALLEELRGYSGDCVVVNAAGGVVGRGVATQRHSGEVRRPGFLPGCTALPKSLH